MTAYLGRVVRAVLPTVSASSAGGFWNPVMAQYYQQAGTWPSGTGADPYFPYNTFLLNGNGTNGAQNNTFLDSSTNNFTVTRNGNTTQGSFSPYVGPGNWSDFYAATSSGWQTPASSATSIIGSAFNSTATFTVEAWIYPLARHSGGGAVLGYVFGQMAVAGANVDWSFGPDSNGNLVLFWYAGGNQISKWTSVIPLNTWTHIALSVNNGTIRMFVNGVQETLTGLTSTTASATTVNYCSSGGYLYAGSTWQGFNGYISNLRVIGKRAVYTTTFTPSTTPLVATTDTTLLTCQQNGFADMSAANWALTITGGVQVSKFSPFTFYQTTPASYSGYFDGNGDYLSAPTTSVQLGSQEFTFETWVYFSDVSTDRTLLYWNANASGYSALHVRASAAKWVLWMSQNGSSWAIQQSALGSTIVAGQWYHVAVVRAGNKVRMFVNGTDITSGGYTLSGSLMTTYTLNQIGVYNSASYYMLGSLSNFRIVSGTAVYTANFTPSTSALTTTTTVPSNQSNSVSFDGNGDYLTVPSNAAFTFGTGDFTVECWIYLNAATNAAAIAGTWATTNAASGWLLSQGFTSTSALRFGMSDGTNTAFVETGSGVLSTGQWIHVAASRASSTLKLFVNGVQQYTGTLSTNASVTAPLIVAAINGGTFASNLFVSNLRVVKGQALYTSAFTPSTLPLTTTSQGATAANVSLLTCQDRLLEDNSLNLLAITAAGDARPSSANPFVTTNGIGGTSYSGFFSGSQYLTSPANAAFAWGTGDFTVELWFCANAAFSSARTNLVGTMGSGGGLFAPTNTNMNWNSFGVGDIMTAAFVPVIGQWYHLAYSRSGTAGKLFVNGVVLASGTDTTNYTNTTFYIGNSTVNPLNGYVSNVRVVKGTAVYTAAFSPSTTPLTAITNTSLLTCQNTTFIDNSPNAFTITNTGSVVTTPFNPFSGATTLLTCQSTTFADNSAIPVTITANGNATPERANPFTDTVTGPTSYAAATYGGSAYFDGTGDYLTLPAPAALGFGTGNFTWEAWIYPSQTSAYQSIYDTSAAGDTSATGRFLVDINAGGVLRLMTAAGTTTLLTSASGAIVANQWQHIAIARSGTTGYMFINGALVNTATVSTNFLAVTASGTNRPIIGAGGYAPPGAPYSGYISNMRVINGTAVYTTPFVPPAAPVTAVTNTQLLLNGTNAGIFDSTTINELETVGAAQISTSVVKYGTGSMSFSGGTSYLITPVIPPTVFFAPNAWTIEGWFYFNSLTGTSGLMGYPDLREVTATATALLATYRNTPATAKWSSITAAISLGTAVWKHIAVVLNNGTMTLYVDGVSVGTPATAVGTPAWGGSGLQRFILGADDQYPFSGTPDVFLNGYIDDFRFTNGYARYTANFTPPTAALPTF